MSKIYHQRLSIKLATVVMGLLVLLALFWPVISWAQTNGGLSSLVDINLNGDLDLISLVARIINIFLGVLGVIALGIIIYAGWVWMTAGGNEEKISKAKQILSAGLIGLIIIVTSYALANFIFNKIIEATNGGGATCSDGTSPPCDNDGGCPGCFGGGDFLKVKSAAPKGGGVALCSRVQSEFNLVVDWTTVNNSSFKVEDVTTGTPVTFWHTDDSFDPGFDSALIGYRHDNHDLAPTSTYQVTLRGSPGGLESINDLRFKGDKDYSWRFTTGTESDDSAPTVSSSVPGNNDINICLATPYQIIFSESMYAPSFHPNSNIVLQKLDANGVVVGDVQLADNVTFGNSFKISTLALAGNNILEPNTKYRLIVKGKTSTTNPVEDLCGNQLVSDYVIEFKSGVTAECTPQITSIVPAQEYYGRTLAPINSVTITGSNLFADGEIFFNNNLAGDDSFDGESNILCWNGDRRFNSGPLAQSCSAGQVKVRVPVSSTTGPAYDQDGYTAQVGQVKVVVGREVSNTLPFTILSPYINSISPGSGGKNQFITLNGWNFGSNPGQIYFIVPTVNGPQKILAQPPASCSANWWSDTEVIVTVPDAATLIPGNNYSVQVVTNSSKPSNFESFKVTSDPPGPGLCQINPNQKAVNELPIDVTLSGERFLTNGVVKFGLLNAGIVNWGDGQIIATTPINSQGINQLAADRWPVTVTVNGQISNSKTFTVQEDNTSYPQVVEEQACSVSRQSPSPWKDSTDACTNAKIVVRFSLPMNSASFTTANIIVQKCNVGGSFNSGACTGSESATLSPIAGVGGASGLEVETANNFDANTWYRATIKKDVLSQGGFNMTSDYTWQWRTKNTTQPCDYSTAVVTPGQTTIRLDQITTQGFTSAAQSSNCNVLKLLDTNWSWNSSDVSKATVTASGNQATAQALAETSGTPVKITAALGTVSAYGNLTILSATSCTASSQCNACGTGTSSCVGGFCQPVITDFSPDTGAEKSWVTINGCYFGNTRGQIVYNQADGSGINGDWPPASICGSTGTWKNNQIISQVPSNAATGFKVVRDSSAPGEVVSPSPFTVGGVLGPNICLVNPDTINESQKGTAGLTIKGIRLGLLSDKVDYFIKKVIKGIPVTLLYLSSTTHTTWSDTEVKTTVPATVSNQVSNIGVRVGDLKSNKLDFKINASTILTPGDLWVNQFIPSSGTSNLCTNGELSVKFNTLIKSSSLNPDNFKLLKTATSELVIGSYSVVNLDENNDGILDVSKVYFKPIQPLVGNTSYTLSVQSGITGKNDEILICNNTHPCGTRFTTGGDICQIDRVTVKPANFVYSSFNQTKIFEAEAWSTNNQLLTVDYLWSKTDTQNVVRHNNATDPAVAFIANNKNGLATLQVDARLTSNPTALAIRGTASVEVFLCEFPWQYLDDVGSPLFNFKLKYCQVATGQTGLDITGFSNSSFANGLTGTWTATSGTWTYDSATGYDDSGSVNTQSLWPSKLVNQFTVEANKTYQASGHIKLLDASNRYYAGFLISKNNTCSGSFANTAANYQPDGNWQRLQTNFFSGDNTSLYFCLYVASPLGYTPTQVVLFDSFNIKEVTNALPELSSPIITAANDNGLLKEILFKVQGSDDLIGLRIYDNQERLKPADWLKTKKSIITPTTLTAIKVDGYPAGQGGQSTYVTALNVVITCVNCNKQIYTNEYILSLNTGAGREAQAIYDQLVQNWQFNNNIDLLLGDSGKLMLQNDLTRLMDVGIIRNLADRYATLHGNIIPQLLSGSYLPKLSTSSWPSWQQTLSKELGSSLPVDPINKFNNCPAGYNSDTCWNEKTNNFICPDGSHIYQYKASADGRTYDFLFNPEVKNANWLGQPVFTFGLSDVCGASSGGTVYGQPTLSVTVTGSGMVSSSPIGINNCTGNCQTTYNGGTEVVLTATAAPGQIFYGWSGSGCTGTGLCRVTMLGAKAVIANFTNTYNVTVTRSGSGGGTVTANPGINCGPTCLAAYGNSTTVILYATANPDSAFVGWSGSNIVCNEIGPCNLVVKSNMSIDARFEKINKVTVIKEGSGQVVSSPSGINCGSDCMEFYINGTSVTLTPKALSGNVFSAWSGDCTGTSLCNLTNITTDKNVTAKFVAASSIATINVTNNKVGGVVAGAITSTNSDKPPINCGDVCSNNYIKNSGTLNLAAYANPGYRFKQWSLSSCGVAVNCALDLSSDHVIGAFFEIMPSGLNLMVGSNGSVTVSNQTTCNSICSYPLAIGQSVTLTAQPSVGYQLVDWSGDCTGVDQTCTLSITGSNQVTARFAPEAILRINVTGASGGIVLSSESTPKINCGGICQAAYGAGRQVELKATPRSGWVFVGWSGSGCTYTNQPTATAVSCLTSSLVSGSNVINVQFAQLATAVVKIQGTGTGYVYSVSPAGFTCTSGQCNKDYPVPTPLSLLASPTNGSSFSSWSGCDSTLGQVCTVNLNTGGSLKTVTATFNPPSVNTYNLQVNIAGSGRVGSGDGEINCPFLCSHAYTSPTTVTLNTSPNSGYAFSNWTGCSSTSGTSCTVNLTTPGLIGVQANFDVISIPSYQLTLTKSGSGQAGVVSGETPAKIDCSDTCSSDSASYLQGSNIVLVAYPSASSAIGAWTGCDSVSNNACYINNITSNRNVSINLVPVYNLTWGINPAAGGTVSITSSIAAQGSCGTNCNKYFSGTQITLQSSPNIGYTFNNWTGNTTCGSSNPCVLTMDATAGNRSITANLTATNYTVTVNKNLAAGGTVTSNLGGINCGTSCVTAISSPIGSGNTVILTISTAGYIFTSWSGGTGSAIACNGSNTSCQFILSANSTITANFVLGANLHVNKLGNGSVTGSGISCGVDCDENYLINTIVTLSARASAGDSFGGWSGCDSVSGDKCTVTMNVTKIVTASFVSSN